VEFSIVADALHDPACVFCKIIKGEIPSARVLETESAVAFLDIQPPLNSPKKSRPMSAQSCRNFVAV
jgi:hypothetical protein